MVKEICTINIHGNVIPLSLEYFNKTREQCKQYSCFRDTNRNLSTVILSMLLRWVAILKFFLPEPSGPAKNKKTFKKWTDWLKRSNWEEEQELMAPCHFLKCL